MKSTEYHRVGALLKREDILSDTVDYLSGDAVAVSLRIYGTEYSDNAIREFARSYIRAELKMVRDTLEALGVELVKPEEEIF